MERRRYTLDILNKDVISVTELNNLRLKYARIANERLRNLEKAGRTFWAYDTAINYTTNAYGKRRYKQAKKWKGSVSGLINELQRITEFLNMETATVGGQRAVDKRIINTFKNKGLNVSDPRAFFRFLDSQSYKNLANKGITSEQLLEYFDRASQQVDEDEIYSELQKFESEEIETVEELFNRQGFSTLDD